MSCGGTVPGGAGSIDLEKELIDSNLRVMAIQTGFLDQVGGTLQFGKRVDLFWLAGAVIVAAVIISVTIFGKKKNK